MKAPFRSIALLAAGAALTLSACADPQAVGDIKASVDRIEASQKDMVTKIEALEKSNKEMIAKAAAAKPAAPNAPDPNKKYDINIGNAPCKGPANAAVTIAEWSDFQCPFCSQAKDLVHQIVDAYPKDVRFCFKKYPLPFHPNAMPAAKAAVAAAKQGKFFEMHDKLFENQRELSPENYVKWAGEIGLNVDQFKKDMESPEVAAQITSDMKEAGDVGVRGTPSFFIDGKQPAGRSFELYKSIIDESIKNKKA
ncbi:MAG TPA: thioredoxin domain-containing protein [Candidatus Limnocylindrales bacterium]|nr:thioredoxin domain-containing protein [Candidatus Limnocylindrales bacterium]